jgi:hypothetical protein
MASGSGEADASYYLGEVYAGLLWRAIAAAGVDADDFQVGPSELRGYQWKLSHQPTGQALHASADLDTRREGRFARADLLLTRANFGPVAEENADPDSYLTLATKWAGMLKWTYPAGQRRGGGPAPAGPGDGQVGENTPFTPAERAEISNQLRAIRDSVRKNYRLAAAQLAAIGKCLEEAEEASKRLGRKDWKWLFYGIVFWLIVNETIPLEVAQHIFMGVLHGIAHLHGVGVPPVPWILGL